jgi:hypothetical protein
VGILDLFSGNPKKFVSRESFETNLANQLAMTPQTLAQLRKYNVTPEKKRQLEFFFYTNATSKAAALAEALNRMQYEVEHRPSASDKRLQVITGWSVAIPMQDNLVLDWSKEMCAVGFEHDCEFDGWGTNAEQ